MLARSSMLTLTFLTVCVSSSKAQTAATLSLQGGQRVVEPVRVEVHAKRKMAATHGEDPSASGTALDLEHRITTPRSLGDVVREAPGALVTNTGGMGAFSAVALRGAASDETLVLLDEIPLSTPDGGAFDLSLFPAELFDKINVFRGGAPVWLGAGAVGGVLQLVPRRRERNGMSATLGAGSFGTYHVHGGAEVSLDSGIRSSSQLLLRGTRGDYAYRDDRGTLFDRSDDLTLRRKNADFFEASGVQDLTIPLWRGTLHLVALGVQRGGGFPGPASQPTPKPRRESSRALVAASYTREAETDGRLQRKVQLVTAGSYGGDRFSDHYGQLGNSKVVATDDHSFRAFVRGAGSLRLARWLETTAVGSYAFDALSPFNGYAFPQPDRTTRHTVAAALEAELSGSLGPVRFALTPSARIEWSHSELHAPSRDTPSFEGDQKVLAPTFRVGGVLEPTPGVALATSVSSGTRVPTVFELFGDRALVLPSLQLQPVESLSCDGGVSLRKRRGAWHIALEQRGFWQERRNAIAVFRTAQFQVGHENLPRVHQWGSESGLRTSVGKFFHVSGSLTWLHAESALGKRLPFRPRFVTYVRPEGTLRFDNAWVSDASISTELWHRSFAYVDGANLAYTSPCLKVAVGAHVSLLARRIRLSARMDDSADARCTDLIGYPLGGRSLFFSLTYQDVVDASDPS